MDNVVVRAPNWLGDVVMSLPLLKALSESLTGAQIHIVIKPEHAGVLELLPPNPKRTVWHYDSRKQHGFRSLRKFCHEMRSTIQGNIDLYLTLPPAFSAALMGIFLGARQRVGYPSNQRGFLLNHKVSYKPGLHRSQEYFRILESLMPDAAAFSRWTPDLISASIDLPFDEYLVLNPNSQAVSRTLPTEKWVELLRPLQNRNYVLTGSPSEAERTAELVIFLRETFPDKSFFSVAGNTNMLQLFKLLQQSKGLITNDSGPAHVAHMLGVPMVVFFGAGDYRNTGPGYAGGRALVLNTGVSCSPCLRNECPLGTLDCLMNLKVQPGEIESFFAPQAETRAGWAVGSLPLVKPGA